jgi:hypothetical protein
MGPPNDEFFVNKKSGSSVWHELLLGWLGMVCKCGECISLLLTFNITIYIMYNIIFVM